MSPDKIYVQIEINGPVERIWQLTQTPQLHEKWDLRFSQIEYLPRANDIEPQRFLYTTRIGFGLKIRGEGESVAKRDEADGRRTSSLTFWSDDPKSLIEEGSGYWKYEPHDKTGTVRFITAYDYSVRFGILGRAVDRLIFRPLMGWATAWSFDRLRLWIEKDLEPGAAIRLSAINLVARLSLAAVWLYQGIVPKLIFSHPDELAMLKTIGLSDASASRICAAMAWVEAGFGMILLLLWRSRWPLWLTLFLMPLAILVVTLRSPSFLTTPFNVATLNLSLFALALIGLVAGRDLPTASRCLRRPSEG